MSGYWYLGSPYSKYPWGIIRAHSEVCKEAGRLILEGAAVYSPIAHTHPIADHAGIDPFDYSIGLPADEPMMEGAKGLIVLMMLGWDKSIGLTHEISFFTERNRPVVYMTPGTIPMEVLR